jgi:hypothetical protein
MMRMRSSRDKPAKSIALFAIINSFTVDKSSSGMLAKKVEDQSSSLDNESASKYIVDSTGFLYTVIELSIL